MRVFVTGATGFVGSAVVKELLDAGHTVLGMARSDAGMEAVRAAGAEAYRGDLTDLESLRAGARNADAVIHTAFIHDFSKFAENCAIDGRAIEALREALAGTGKMLLVTSGTGAVSGRPGALRMENDPPVPSEMMPRVSEKMAEAFASKGVKVVVMRLPQVHNTEKAGLVTYTIALAREKGVSPYVGDGNARWAAVHRADAARLYRLALEKGRAAKYHAVAEEGVTAKEIAEAIGAGLKVPVKSIAPEEAPAHFGWLAMFAGLDMPASSEWTRKELGWTPAGPGLIEDLKKMKYE
ncbi:MAG: SDR family oxidoreductase [Acidobacteriota bacterium]|nr:SDR family oxidoreductase [Acidobacteriota bacterium]